MLAQWVLHRWQYRSLWQQAAIVAGRVLVWRYVAQLCNKCNSKYTTKYPIARAMHRSKFWLKKALTAAAAKLFVKT
jgi:hypothetical protein